MIITEQITVTLTGATGANDTRHPVNGVLVAVYIDYTGQSGTCDVALTTKGSSAPAKSLLTITDANTDGWFFPRAQVHGVTGTALTLDGTRLMVDVIPIDDYITVTIAGGSAGSVVVYVQLEC